MKYIRTKYGIYDYEPTREDDEALKRLLSAEKYVSYDGNMIVFSNLSWMEHKK